MTTLTAASDERVARMGLCGLKACGDPRLAEEVAERGAVTVWSEVSSDAENRWQGTASRVDPEQIAAATDAAGARFVVPGDAEWPQLLDDLDGHEVTSQGWAPLGLWVLGARLDTLTPAVAVVGARAATSYGEAVAYQFGAGLADAGYATVAGLAFGIDSAAHQGALNNSHASTIAVLPSGIDKPYPWAHRDLADRIETQGALVSEVPPGTSPTRNTLLARNRIIAGLTQGTVLVEAATRSGALTTAQWATTLGRPVMAVPGAITNPLSTAPNQLIHNHTATSVINVRGILDELPG